MAKKIITKQPAGENMEERIMVAAERLFISKGFSGTSTTEIANEAGCNQALVHYYFRTKEKLFRTILKDKVKKFFQESLFIEAGEGSFNDKLERMIGIHFDVIRQNQKMVPFIINEFSRNPEGFEELLKELQDIPGNAFASMQKDLDGEIKSGRIRDISLTDLVLNVVSMNAFMFIIKPLFARIWQLDEKQMEAVLEERKKETIKTIVLSLRP